MLLHPVSLAAHTHLVVFVCDDWCTQSDVTHREALKLTDSNGEVGKGEGPVDLLGPRKIFAGDHYANQTDRFD